MFPLETLGPVQEGFGGAADERERGAQLPLKLLGAQRVVRWDPDPAGESLTVLVLLGLGR